MMWSKIMMKSITEDKDYIRPLLTNAFRKAKNNSFKGRVLPEEYWDAAARELDII